MDLRYRFIHTKDLANAAFFLMNRENVHNCYIASGESCIKKGELANVIAAHIGFRGEIRFDTEKKIGPQVNATPARLIAEGWRPSVGLEEGISDMVEWMAAGHIL